MSEENKEFSLPPIPKNSSNFAPPPIPGKAKASEKNLYVIVGSVLAVVVLCIIVGVIVSNNRSNNYTVNSYYSSNNSLKEGEVGLRGSNGSEYGVQIDEDYYSSLGAESSNSNGNYYGSGYSDNNRSDNNYSNNNYAEKKYTSSNIEPKEDNWNDPDYTSSDTPDNSSSAVSSTPENEYKVGNLITFGKRTWLVLDVQGNKALIFSADQLYRPYDDTPYYYSHKDEPYTWGISYLRKYLNGEYYNNFTIPERNRILTTDLLNEDNPDWGSDGGNNTQDKIFVLSASEMLRYGNTIAEFKNKLSIIWSDGWLRTPGRYPNRTTALYFFIRDNNTSNFNLKINYEGDDPRGEKSINPTMWIKTDK